MVASQSRQGGTVILVFGANGQLGRALRARAQAKRIGLAGIGRASADVSGPAAVESVLADIKPDLVVNAAGYTDVDKAENEVEAARRANALGPAVIAEACAERGIPLIHI